MSLIEAAARALYDREKERATHCESVLTGAFRKPVTDTMEPWNDVADIYRADAKAALDAACDAIGWPEIDAYHAELRRGQSIYEDGGGFFARAIRALLGRPHPDPVVTYQDAARALLDGVRP